MFLRSLQSSNSKISNRFLVTVQPFQTQRLFWIWDVCRLCMDVLKSFLVLILSSALTSVHFPTTKVKSLEVGNDEREGWLTQRCVFSHLSTLQQQFLFKVSLSFRCFYFPFFWSIKLKDQINNLDFLWFWPFPKFSIVEWTPSATQSSLCWWIIA